MISIVILSIVVFMLAINVYSMQKNIDSLTEKVSLQGDIIRTLIERCE